MRTIPLKRFVDPTRPITYGIVQAGPDVPGGVPYIRPVDMDVHRGIPDPSLLRTTSHEIAGQYRRSEVRGGDIVVSIGPSYGKTMVVPSVLSGANLTQGTARVAPSPKAEPRYLRWALQSSLATDFWNTAVGGATFRALNLDPLAQTPIPDLPLAEQRRIADYLDWETARIGTLIAKKRRMVALLEERRSGIIESTIRDLAANWGERSLRFVAPEILVGIVVTPAAFYADQGVLALRGMNVKPGRLDLGDTVSLSPEGHALHRKSVLHAGDLVVVRTGQAGAACVVPSDLDGVNCIDVLIVRRSSDLDPSFLEYVLNSDWTVKHIAEHSVGTIQSHFNVGALKQLPVPVPPKEVQERVASDLAAAVQLVDELQRRAQRQVDLLVEHRQALITAAVTGELPVPEVAA